MTSPRRWNGFISALLITGWLAACGGGGDSPARLAASNLAQEPGAPAASGNIALDGFNWLNYRRNQMGLPLLARNSRIDAAAQGHSAYQSLNNQGPSHEQVAGKPGFTGAHLADRLAGAGYVFAPAAYLTGEVIVAAASDSGAFMSETLLAAVYHRFVMFEPMFKEAGAGAAGPGANDYTYFTGDFTANNGFGPGLGHGQIATYPFAGQSQVPPNFMSDNESPDPVPGQNEVGYPVSVHADFADELTVQSFTLRARGGEALPVRLLSAAGDKETPRSAAAIIPLAPLAGQTTYDVAFVGAAGHIAVTRNWSFSTR